MTPRIDPLAITAYTATTAAGIGIDAFADALFAGRGGLVANDYTERATGVPLATFVGPVAGVDAVRLPDRLAARDCRQHRLAWLGLAQDDFVDRTRDAIARFGAGRVAVLLGTSTSTIEATEQAYREARTTGRPPVILARRNLHHLHATTAFAADTLGAGGPATTTSTACSSSAKVFAQAARMIRAGLVDAAVVGGVDSLCASTLFGFHALGLVSASPCRPFDVARDGISIGEAAGFALVERRDPSRHRRSPLLIGSGESSDAHHQSAPHPAGVGARLAIGAALDEAGIGVDAVDYVNLHGTATAQNDAVEAALVASVYRPRTRASSTKGWTGHALGAAGVVEAVACLIALDRGFAPGMLGCRDLDPACGPQMRIGRGDDDVAIAVSHAFAFGGSNCVLAFARDAEALESARSCRPDHDDAPTG